MDRNLLSFIGELQNAATADACWRVFLETVRNLGIPLAQYGQGRFSSSGAMESSSTSSALPQDYRDHYARHDQVKHDHLVKHALRSDAPARWYNPEVQLTLSPDELRVERDAFEFGMRAGIMFPIREVRERVVGAISFAAETGREAEFESILERNQSHFHLMGLFLHNEIRRREMATATRILTPRERECLLWTAAGLSAKEIGFRLNTSPKTVENQLDSVRQKLGARNRTHAVVKAITMGIIDP